VPAVTLLAGNADDSSCVDALDMRTLNNAISRDSTGNDPLDVDGDMRGSGSASWRHRSSSWERWL